jgi:hypothetical protein
MDVGSFDQFGNNIFLFLLPRCDSNCHIVLCKLELLNGTFWGYWFWYVHTVIDWYENSQNYKSYGLLKIEIYGV